MSDPQRTNNTSSTNKNNNTEAMTRHVHQPSSGASSVCSNTSSTSQRSSTAFYSPMKSPLRTNKRTSKIHAIINAFDTGEVTKSARPYSSPEKIRRTKEIKLDSFKSKVSVSKGMLFNRHASTGDIGDEHSGRSGSDSYLEFSNTSASDKVKKRISTIEVLNCKNLLDDDESSSDNTGGGDNLPDMRTHVRNSSTSRYNPAGDTTKKSSSYNTNNSTRKLSSEKVQLARQKFLDKLKKSRNNQKTGFLPSSSDSHTTAGTSQTSKASHMTDFSEDMTIREEEDEEVENEEQVPQKQQQQQQQPKKIIPPVLPKVTTPKKEVKEVIVKPSVFNQYKATIVNKAMSPKKDDTVVAHSTPIKKISRKLLPGSQKGSANNNKKGSHSKKKSFLPSTARPARRSQTFTEIEDVIPPPGESFNVDPFGSLKVSFDRVYNLTEVINSGNFGTVWKAHHVAFPPSAQVAVKVVVKSDDYENNAVIEEAKVLRDIRDLSNITRLFDFYMDDTNLYVVQELAAGGDVFDRLIERTKYTENDARDLAIFLLQTIEALHAARLIHRDLKPENLLLKSTKSDTNILLCDFGLAKFLPEDGSGLHTHCGTPNYTAPEIVNGVEYWEEVDMWSVGCILYMLLGGYLPFEGNEFEIYQYISTADYDFKDPAWDVVSDDVKDLISRLLELEQNDRLSASDALNHIWFSASRESLMLTDLTKTKDAIKTYVDTRPPDLHYIDTEYTGDEDVKYSEPEQIVYQYTSDEDEDDDDDDYEGSEDFDVSEVREESETIEEESEAVDETEVAEIKPGDSLKVDPLGTFKVPFDEVYELGETEVCNGGFGWAVYEGYHLTVSSPPRFFVKVIDRTTKNRDEQEDIDAACELILWEASILKDLRNVPSIVRLYDLYMDKHKIYMVLETASGADVFDRLVEKGTYNESEAKEVVLSLLHGIEAIHDKRLLHRNLKPENLILKSKHTDTNILIRGFNYAKYLPANIDEGLWTRCGTPAFVAPEIVEGIEYWEEIDMWSVGCIIYMLLSGYKPFEGDNEMELYELIAAGDYGFDDAKVWSRVTSTAKSLISQLLALDRKHRLNVKKAIAHEWFQASEEEEFNFSPGGRSNSIMSIPGTGESLKAEPLGSLNVPFNKVYQIGDFLLEGSFGVMHKAYHHASIKTSSHGHKEEFEVTVQIIDRDGDHAEVYLHNTTILKGLAGYDLPHIFKLLDFYTDKEYMYVVYGNTAVGDVFEKLIEMKYYKEKHARQLFKTLLKAIQSIHVHRLVHRNIKPENLIIKTSNRNFTDIVLGGFGYAKYLPNERDCGLWTLCGTPEYSAPEILNGTEYYEEVDMWSAGVTLYALLCGTRPFEGESRYETYDLIVQGDYEFESSVWNKVSDEAKELISKLLVVDSKERLTATQALDSSWFSTDL